ncbi:MAG: cobalt transporter [Lachnospiraceae bacterium]|nr:cobalt transporter [Lachnospiraceae bacterium]
MHLIKDENGNPIPHGGQEHTAESCENHGHCHDHEHSCQHCDGDHKDETTALLGYMLSHNEHHAQELEQMAVNLEKLGMSDAAAQIKEAVSEFQKGNMRLSLALTLVKEHIKEA